MIVTYAVTVNFLVRDASCSIRVVADIGWTNLHTQPLIAEKNTDENGVVEFMLPIGDYALHGSESGQNVGLFSIIETNQTYNFELAHREW